MPKVTKTPLSSWTKVFRAIVARIENDPKVRGVFGGNIRSWKGTGNDSAPMVPQGNTPILRLSPKPGNVDWYSPDSQFGVLSVKVEIAVQSLCIDDCLDLYDLLASVLKPSNDGLCQALIAAGAETGEIVFSDPAMAVNPEASTEGFFTAEGAFRLQVLRTIES